MNGDKRDNRVENLRFLCPNCDSQTEHFCGRNRPGDRAPYRPNKCADCGTPVTFNATRCLSCSGKTQRTKAGWPPTDRLVEMVEASSFVAVARELGVSDNAVRKRLKTRGIVTTRNHKPG